MNIFNYNWTTGKFPDDWQYATTIPIPKPGKDAAEPNNYRHIALTSCLCKTLERMMNKILTWFLESNNHISQFQSGFRSDRSTTDNLVRLETFIRDALIKKEHAVAVFFDLEKAYDTIEESKFLGILFHRKVSFIPHIKYLKAKCLNALNLLIFLGCRPNYTSVSSPVKIRLWLYYIWLCTKIISSNALSYT